MAVSRVTHDVKTIIPNLVPIAGSIAPNGTGAPTINAGKGFTVSRTGVGDYLITFDQIIIGIVSKQISVQTASDTDTAVKWGDYTAASKTLQFYINTAGVAADLAADANASVDFVVWVRNSSLGV